MFRELINYSDNNLKVYVRMLFSVVLSAIDDPILSNDSEVARSNFQERSNKLYIVKTRDSVTISHWD